MPSSPTSAPDISPPQRAEAARLNTLLERTPGFTYLRLGDGELRFLLSAAAGECRVEDHTTDHLSASVEVARGLPGLHPPQAPALRAAYERCAYLDCMAGNAFIREHLPGLHLARSPGAITNADPATGFVIRTWTYLHFGDYVRAHSCLVCGAEAALQGALLERPGYRAAAARYWPAEAQVRFVSPPENGAHLAANLSRTLDLLRAEVARHRPHTVLLALGGAAKILAVQLAAETGVRVIDWGSLLRALTYSGSDGYASWRSPHNPYLFRVPLADYDAALCAAQPELPPALRVAKAHAQLCLDLQVKQVLRSPPSDVNDPSAYDPSPENLAAYRESLDYYFAHVRPLAAGDPEARRLVAEFDLWREKKGLTLKGRVRAALRRARAVFR